jgi:glycosyltransferase involved in cell wall biosynthesis
VKIAFESSPLVTKKKTGISYYSTYLIKKLIADFFNNEYVYNFFCIRHKKEKLERIEKIVKNKTAIHCFPYANDYLFSLFTKLIPIPYNLIFKEKCQITHFFDFFIPPGVKGRKIVNIYDMVYKAYPETMNHFRLMLDFNLKDSCSRADKIITISEFSKCEIIKYLSVDPSKIAVTLLGVDTNIFYPIKDNSLILKVKNKFNIRTEYFLFIGTIEPRKNILRLIEAYIILKERYKNVPQLVLIGQLGWKYETILKKININNLEDDVKFIGYISDADKVLLLNGAFAFLYPSLYEGFGLPPLEAMACAIPVLTSNLTSLPEVVGDAALTVDPLSIDSMLNGLEYLLFDQELRNELSVKALKRAKEFTWDSTAYATMQIYQSLK